MANLTILRGLPGSGKDAVSREHFVNLKGYTEVSPDRYHADIEKNGYTFNGYDAATAHRRAQHIAAHLLENNVDVVYPATFSKPWEINEVLRKVPAGTSITVMTVEAVLGNIPKGQAPQNVIDRIRRRWTAYPNELVIQMDITKPNELVYLKGTVC